MSLHLGRFSLDGHVDYSFLMVLWLEELFEHVARHSLARTFNFTR
jgi:hypothetical protein